jgi:hypothetical protein
MGSSAFFDAKCEIKNGPGCLYRTQRGDPMDKYDVIGMVIAILAVSVVLMH